MLFWTEEGKIYRTNAHWQKLNLRTAQRNKNKNIDLYFKVQIKWQQAVCTKIRIKSVSETKKSTTTLGRFHVILVTSTRSILVIVGLLLDSKSEFIVFRVPPPLF